MQILKSAFGVLLLSSFPLVVACTSSSTDGPSAGEESDVTGTKDCDLQQALCEIPVPQCPRGETPSVRNGCFGPCVKVAQCKPGSFECNQGGPALCEIVPPTCRDGETLTTRDGCFGPCVPSNICRGSTPDTNKPDCDVSKVQCEITFPQCPAGETPTVDADGFCFGKCVPIAQCRAKSFNCNQGGPALCEIVPPQCDPGERLTTRNGCFGPCVPEGICK